METRRLEPAVFLGSLGRERAFPITPKKEVTSGGNQLRASFCLLLARRTKPVPFACAKQ
jgi:hypothetical protein